MHFQFLPLLALLLLTPLACSAHTNTTTTTLNPGPAYDRLDKTRALLLVVDLQVGLFQLVRDKPPTPYRNSILAHSSLGPLFNLPTILTTSAQTGPNGPLPKEILALHSTAPLIQRQGEVDAWDNAEFRAAVRASGKDQIIIAGITTDVCTAFLSLSLRAEGYDVWANTDASGTFDVRTAEDANVRMREAGVHTLGLFAIVCELMRDWRNVPGAATVLPYFDECVWLRACGDCADLGIGFCRRMGTWRERMLRRR